MSQPTEGDSENHLAQIVDQLEQGLRVGTIHSSEQIIDLFREINRPTAMCLYELCKDGHREIEDKVCNVPMMIMIRWFKKEKKFGGMACRPFMAFPPEVRELINESYQCRFEKLRCFRLPMIVLAIQHDGTEGKSVFVNDGRVGRPLSEGGHVSVLSFLGAGETAEFSQDLRVGVEDGYIMLRPHAKQENLAHPVEQFIKEALEDVSLMRIDIRLDISHYTTVSMMMEEYKEHCEKPFFDELIHSMTTEFGGSGLVVFLVSQTKPHPTPMWKRLRDLCGPTDPAAAGPETIRGKFGVRQRPLRYNVVHCPDSEEAMRQFAKRWMD